ncbi:MAG: class I SAM-dependent methyltransferase [Nitrospirota bacterium]
MSVSEELRKQIISQMQGAMMLNIAFIGISNNLFSVLNRDRKATPDELAGKTGLDRDYLNRWCDAAYAFGLLDESDGKFSLTDIGSSFIAETPGTAMPFSVQSVLSAHMCERAASLMRSGERPGEMVLAERTSILPLFGPMLEAMFSGVFEQQILPNVPVYRETDEKGGLIIDLGCGNGWYLRRIVTRFPHLRGIGLDGFEENINQATKIAQDNGLSDRLKFMNGDIYHFSASEPANLIAMNRALHHVWDKKEDVFRILKEHLKAGGSAVIWEPNWPKDRSELRDPMKKGMVFQNLAEHIQGNHFLMPEEIEAEFHRVGMKTEVYLFANGNEAVIVGKKV